MRVATYGGLGTDLDNDGFLDITVANEIVGDLRVFMNTADGTGLFAPYLTPPTLVKGHSSPTEPYDFNNDGNADIVVGNKGAVSVSILLGNGDGTFAPQQEIPVTGRPAGVTVLDINGDGHVDIANTATDSGNVSYMLNNGNGVFGAPNYFDGGVSLERSIMAGDMNNDGISDIVVGGVSNIRVHLSNGDGTFDAQPAQSSAATGVGSWQIMLGDVDGDGNLDVSTSNPQANNGAILLGDGTGRLDPPDVFNLSPYGSGGPTATDFGDIDGDGDLDWITSSPDGQWVIKRNDGNGNFSFYEAIQPQPAASCSLILDIDNDGDLDLALIDESVDTIMIMANAAVVTPSWLANDSGDWNDGSNWAGGAAPNSNEQGVVFGAVTSSPETVFTNTAVTVMSVRFISDNTYVIGGTGSVNLEAATGNAMLDVDEGSHEFQAIVNLQSDTDADVADGAQLAFNNLLDLNGRTLTKTGGGTLTINNQLITDGGEVIGLGGMITGSGTVSGDLDNSAAIVSPGNSPGIFEVTGDYSQGDEATLQIEIGGTTLEEQYDQLMVGGTADLAGILDVQLIDDFQPGDGDSFSILEFGSVAGTFDQIQLPTLDDGLAWDDSSLYVSGQLSVTAIPEPSALALAALLSLFARFKEPRNTRKKKEQLW